MKLILLISGGALGTFLRYNVVEYGTRFNSGNFPLGTLMVNLIGSFLIGLSWGLMGKENIKPETKAFLFVGLFGGFTTFSSFALENFHLMRGGDFRTALTYLTISNIGGILLVFAGYIFSQTLLNFFRR
ncbi:MAG: fluoride efflux transporter CrcB [Bacteroidota bacterium]|nr:fluoride efflux transporter CrcB [Bacteroidota bacterium]